MAGAEMTELQDMFAANARPKTQEGGAGGTGKKKKKNEKHSVLRDAQRAQNVVIGLAQFKVCYSHYFSLYSVYVQCESFALTLTRFTTVVIGLAQFKSFKGGFAEVMQAVVWMDRSRLAARHLETLIDIGPKPEELKKMETYRGDPLALVEAEQFFLATALVPRLPSKLSSFLFTIQFDELAAGTRRKVGVIMRASAQAKESDNLMKVPLKKGCFIIWVFMVIWFFNRWGGSFSRYWLRDDSFSFYGL